MNFAESVLKLVNIERSKIGVSPLKLSSSLNRAATFRASEITQEFDHTRPNGKDFFTVIDEEYSAVGENIAEGYSTPEEVMECWMNSRGHRENILRSDFTELGVGYYRDKNSEYEHYWVQIFMRPMD